MTGIKLTSPGVLLILAVIAGGSVFLVDVFYLRPNAQQMEQDAVFERARGIWTRTEQQVSDDIGDLARACEAAATEAGLEADSFRQTGPGIVRLTGSSVLAVTDGNGRLLHPPRLAEESADDPSQLSGQQLGEVFAVILAAEGTSTGLVYLDGEVGAYVRHPISRDGQDLLWLIRPLAVLQPNGLDRVVKLVVGEHYPESQIDVPLTPMALNPKYNSDQLEIFWPSRKIFWPASGDDEPLEGYFIATTSIRQIRLRAASTRSSTLILLSLSVGIASLLFLGVHIMIAGPVYRLMKRLRTIELGDQMPKELTRDLHGEPLVLARRLESAFDRLAQMSRTDELTGLANRRHFTNVLEAFYTQARRYSRPLSLIVMDIDFFKAVNDTGGHQVGDDLLKAVAAAIEAASRKADLPARLGGDEFAILLPETSAVDAEPVAERIRQGLSDHSVMNGSDIRVTLSIGIADLNAGEIDSPMAMQSTADRALYAAKENGRNCVVQAHRIQGLSLTDGGSSEQVNKLYKKLAGLDNQFKDMFLNGLEEVIDILETRAPHMADHARKVERYATMIAQEMGLPPRAVKRVEIAAMLHDIGMLAMPDSILMSADKLSSQDLRLLRQHPLISVRIMEGMEFLEQEIPAVRYHHEWFNGSGYPEGIAGAAIPLSAKIIAVADAFDAMTSARSFRQAISVKAALTEIHDHAGRQFDPEVAATFCALAKRLGTKLPLSGERLDRNRQPAAPAAR